MLRYRHKKKRLMGEINVVPYIDVMLVLLVIFMVTAPMLTQGVKVDLPNADAQPIENPESQSLVITVTRNGKYYLDDKEFGARDLQARVAAVLRLKPRTPVMLRGDRRAAYDDIVQAMVLLQAAGAPSVGLVTDDPPKR